MCYTGATLNAFSILNHHLFTFGSDQVTLAEILGFITGLVTVYLVVVERVWNFPIGIANSAFFMILFLHAGLYADGYLQIMYIVLGFAGWWAWLKAGPQRTELSVVWGRAVEVVAAAGLGAIVTAVLYPILRHAHDIAPWWDALTTGLSVSAQSLLNFKRIQNWFFWIVADLIYIPLYFAKDLYLTGIVYMCFLTLCMFGLRAWTRSEALA